MLILGIETTCDETAVGIVRAAREGPGEILANEVISQIARHAAYGGVVPEIAARAHVDFLDRLIRRALKQAKIQLSDLDGIAAAAGPGLVGGILVGLTTGKALALAAHRPFVAVNHLEAHALTPRLMENIDFPFMVLLMSGGHTQLVAVRDIGVYERLGSTVDDALGEAFDKVAKLLGLSYPGGPQIEKAARDGDPARFAFPRPMMGRPIPNFSFSGLKTAVRTAVQKFDHLTAQDVADISASFQAAAVDIMVERTRVGVKVFRQSCGNPQALVMAGGVAANGVMRAAMHRFCSESGLPLMLPPPALCTDNGVMIAWAGLERLRLGLIDDLGFAARPRWPLDASAESIHNGKA